MGAAAVSEGTSRTAILPLEASVFSAELYALELAISIAKSDRTSKFVIFSDSLSVLTQLKTIL